MIDTKRKHIQDWIEDVQTTDSYDIGRCQLNWLSSREEWQLILPNKEILTEDSYNGVGDLLAHIDDSDILDYYPTIAEHYTDQTLMDRAWFLACEAEGYANGEVPDWAIQMVSDTQLEIYNELETA